MIECARRAPALSQSTWAPREYLRAFHEKGQRPWYGYTMPVGFPHEDPARKETWGPRSRDDVDWTGF